jgi:DNA-binding NtrC family response regulator
MQTILAIDDESSVLESYRVILGQDYHFVSAPNAKEGLAVLAETHADLILLDLMMPVMTGTEFLAALAGRDDPTPVVVVSGVSSVEPAIEAMRRGARDFLVKPFDVNELTLVVERVLADDRMTRELRVLREADASSFQAIVGESGAVKEVFALAKQAALADATVLITGESGTGKDMLARAIHSAGQRAANPFVHVSCCALPDQLVESELFGHERGAFTGALEKRDGKVQVADGGTLFLDEIGEMPMATQSKILQMLQDSCFYPVGSHKSIEVDVRFICATNRILPEEVKKGAFRQDLYYRINVVHIEMPPLRGRREDIPILANHFLAKHSLRLNAQARALSHDALTTLAAYDWPGNIRELENVMQRVLVVHSQEETVTAEHVAPITAGASASPQGFGELDGLPLQEAVGRLERHLIQRALARTNQVQSKAAEMLGTTRRILKYKMDQLAIPQEASVDETAKREAS